VSSIYLVRHGQAGTRLNYDALSDLGRRQAVLLGESLIAQGIQFAACIAGAMQRQQETAAEVSKAYARAGAAFPEIETDPEWNEFDLDAVYRDLAPVIAAEDPQFRAEFEEMQGQMADAAHSIHRRWSRCDIQVVRAWLEGRHPCQGETWEAFQQRIERAYAGLDRFGSGNVAVFTSATPIGVGAGIALQAATPVRARLAGVLYNSAYSVLRRKNGEMALFSYNNTPHLVDGSVRTFR
jgi:broad specificity phosphatase PhoE